MNSFDRGVYIFPCQKLSKRDGNDDLGHTLDIITESMVSRESVRKYICFCLETILQKDILKNRFFYLKKNAEFCSSQVQKQR